MTALAPVLRRLRSSAPGAVIGVVAAWAVLALGQPALALSLRALFGAIASGADSAVLAGTVATALTTAVLAQALYLSYLLRIEILDRAGVHLTAEVLANLSRRPGVAHLEDAATLGRIRVALEGWAVAGAITGSAQLIAVVLGLLLTFPLLGAAGGAALLLVPLCLPLVAAAARAFQLRVRGAEAAASADRRAERLLAMLVDPAGAAEIRIAGTAPILLDEYRRLCAAGTSLRTRAIRRGAGAMALAWAVFLLGFGVLLAVLLVGQRSTAAEVVPVIALALQMQGIAVVMVNGSTEIVHGRQVVRARRAIAAPTGPQGDRDPERSPQRPAPERLTSGLVLRGVSFSYPGARRPALSDVDLELPAGSFVALLGTHGSGKSTLVKLLLRLYEPSAGRIDVDGHRLDGLRVADWRRRTSACFQDYVRLPASLGESVGVGDLPHADDTGRVRAALGRAGAGSLEGALPGGLSTPLGEPGLGTELSGGQWQRVALARGLMREDPLLVVLDEPTASFDPIAEQELFDSQLAAARTLGARQGTVTLAVTHRFSTVQSADLIVVLRDGRVLESGTHEQLLATPGLYARTHAQQREAHR